MDIREIARRAKVSPPTVSRAINHVPTVDPHLSGGFLEGGRGAWFYPNTQARALVFGAEPHFWPHHSEITNPFFPEIVQVFERMPVQHITKFF